MYEWKVRPVATVEVLEAELNGLERDGFEIHDIHWGLPTEKAAVHIVARRAFVRRNTDIEELLSDQAAEAQALYAGSDRPEGDGL